MKHFKIGLSTPIDQTLFTEFIRKQQKVDFSHVYLAFYEPDVARWVIYHATLKGFFPLSEEEFLKHNIIINEYLFDVNDIQKIELKNWIINNLGKKYGLAQLVYIYLYQDLGWKLEFLKNNDYWVCCEAAARALRVMDLITDIDYDLVDLKYTKDTLDKLNNNN